MKSGKFIKDYYKNVDTEKLYNVSDAINILLNNKRKTFDETIEVSLNLGIDPRHSDQMVRGSVSLPWDRKKVELPFAKIKIQECTKRRCRCCWY